MLVKSLSPWMAHYQNFLTQKLVVGSAFAAENLVNSIRANSLEPSRIDERTLINAFLGYPTGQGVSRNHCHTPPLTFLSIQCVLDQGHLPEPADTLLIGNSDSP